MLLVRYWAIRCFISKYTLQLVSKLIPVFAVGGVIIQKWRNLLIPLSFVRFQTYVEKNMLIKNETPVTRFRIIYICQKKINSVRTLWFAFWQKMSRNIDYSSINDTFSSTRYRLFRGLFAAFVAFCLNRTIDQTIRWE